MQRNCPAVSPRPLCVPTMLHTPGWRARSPGWQRQTSLLWPQLKPTGLRGDAPKRAWMRGSGQRQEGGTAPQVLGSRRGTRQTLRKQGEESARPAQGPLGHDAPSPILSPRCTPASQAEGGRGPAGLRKPRPGAAVLNCFWGWGTTSGKSLRDCVRSAFPLRQSQAPARCAQRLRGHGPVLPRRRPGNAARPTQGGTLRRSTAPGRRAPRSRRAGRARPAAGGPGRAGRRQRGCQSGVSAGEASGMAPPATGGIPPTSPSLGPTAAWLGNRSALGGSPWPRSFAAGGSSVGGEASSRDPRPAPRSAAPPTAGCDLGGECELPAPPASPAARAPWLTPAASPPAGSPFPHRRGAEALECPRRGPLESCGTGARPRSALGIPGGASGRRSRLRAGSGRSFSRPPAERGRRRWRR